MLLKHYFTPKIAHSSYILGGKDTCAVIDPRRDVQLYLDEAHALGLEITHILETHLHADFVSGHMDLAERTGAKIYAPASAECAFPHVALAEGDRIELEHLQLDVLETPGHTPEHISYVVTDTSRGNMPVGLFCGDTLFVGDVGRPDLFPGRADELAQKLYHSLHDKLLKLPDYVEVYPAHGAGSLCGRSMAAKWTSTIGYERQYNPVLQIEDLAAFVSSLTSDMPPAPDHFSRCSEINRRGPALVDDLPALRELSPAAFQQRLQEGECVVLDIRDYAAYGGHHIAGSWHIGLAGNFATFAGWIMPTDKEVLLVADDLQSAQQAVIWARRVGLDRITATLEGGMGAWAAGGLATASISMVSVEDLHDRVLGGDGFVLLDVRAAGEFADSHIQGAVNIPAPDLRTRHVELNPDKTTLVICSTGNRSSMATSILEQKGFRDMHNVAGGMTGYSAAGYARRCAVCENPHGPKTQIVFSPLELSGAR
jgi:hydroxyacylglutathione hydrolase